MSEQECKAIQREGDSPPNPLFTPPCDCPRCATLLTYEHSDDDGWLRRSGDSRRYRVEAVELGSTGRAVLG